MMLSFNTIIALRIMFIRYHVYKETSWSNAKLDDKVEVELEMDAKSLSTNR